MKMVWARELLAKEKKGLFLGQDIFLTDFLIGADQQFIVWICHNLFVYLLMDTWIIFNFQILQIKLYYKIKREIELSKEGLFDWR